MAGNAANNTIQDVPEDLPWTSSRRSSCEMANSLLRQFEGIGGSTSVNVRSRRSDASTTLAMAVNTMGRFARRMD